MSDKEKIHIKLGISGTYWDKKPQYRILANDVVIKQDSIVKASDEIEYIEFDFEYGDEGACLGIQLEGKIPSDTVQNEDKTAIVKDLLLNIVSIEVDDIDLSQIPFRLSEYCPNSPVQFRGETVDLVKNCMNLGWNGTWTLRWTNPFYLWLLENM